MNPLYHCFEQEANMLKTILRWVPMGIFILLVLAALELNKNSLWGWAVTILLFGLYIFLYVRFLGEKPFGFKLLAFLGLLVLTFGAFMLSWPPTKAVPAVSYPNPKTTEIIELQDGKITGVYNEDGKVKVYTGIPYAQPPVGDLRWKEPQDPAPWDGILVCDHFAPMSMQPVNLPIYNSLAQIIGYHDYKISLTDNYIAPVSEDSLYLNIWQPAEAKPEDKLPVIVYIHGGSLQTGQPWYDDYSGETLAHEGVIVVNMGYRLGVFGFFADEELIAESDNKTTGNYGLLDQIKALEWVQKNIAVFGGNPSNVTVAGESAGSACVSALLTSPLAEGLFCRAVLESSTVSSREPAHSFRLMEAALKSGDALKARYGATSVEELRKVSADQLVAEASSQHHITVDGYALLETPFEAYLDGTAMNVPLMHGFNAHEGAAFIIFGNAKLKDYPDKVRAMFGEKADEILKLYQPQTDAQAKEYWEKLYSAYFFTYGHYCLSRQAGRQNAPVYAYYFAKDNGRLGTWHSGEEVYLYGRIPEDSDLYTEEDRLLSRQMVQYYVNFATCGDPNGIAGQDEKTDLPYWPVQTDPIQLYQLDENPRTVDDPFWNVYSVLDEIMGWNE